MAEELYNIFYTDDDTDDQEVFREIVTEINEDIYIFTQSNGDELMALLRNPPPRPHLIFLDLNMPVKNGYDVLKEIRQSEIFRKFPVVIFSTSTDEEAIDITWAHGASLYIPKPTSYNELKGILRQVLEIDWDHFERSRERYLYNGHIVSHK